MDDVSLTIFVNKSAQAMRVTRPVERWKLLSRLHASVVADLRAKRLDRDLATVQADMAIEAVLEAMADGARQTQMTVRPSSSSRRHPIVVRLAISP